MKRILLLTQTTKPTSGWGRIADELSRRLVSRGYEPVIATEDDSSINCPPYLLKNALPSLKSALQAGYRIRSLVKNCDLIHALDAYPYGLIGALANIGINKPLAITAIGTYAIMPLESRKLRPFMVWAYRRATIILPIVNFTMQELRKKVTHLPRLERVLLGVDASQFTPIILAKRATDRPYFLSVGALKKRRGCHVAFPALALLKVRHPNVQYILAGDDSDHNYVNFLRSEIVKYHLEDIVVIKGFTPPDEVRRLYEQCTAFVLIPENSPTNFAGFHLVYLEANAMGKPVVGAKGYGSEETVIDGKNGFLVSPHDPAGLAEILNRLLTDDNLLSQLAHGSREMAESLSWDKTVDAYCGYYTEILMQKYEA